MIAYKYYKDLMERQHKMGSNDCFGIVRDLYKNAYGIELPNFARPMYFYDERLNLYAKIRAQPYFKDRGLCPIDFKEGDLLAFRVAGSSLVNHIGIYLGNNLFLHHLIEGVPREENLDTRWLRRLYMASYHVDVPVTKKRLTHFDVMPDYMKGENYVQP